MNSQTKETSITRPSRREIRKIEISTSTLLASAVARSRHLVIGTHRTYVGVTRQACHHIHEMIVTKNRTCVLLASEDMITQRIDAHLAGAKRATVSVVKHLGGWALRNSCRKKPAKRQGEL